MEEALSRVRAEVASTTGAALDSAPRGGDQGTERRGALAEALRPAYLGGRKLPRRVVTLAAYFDDSFQSGGPVYTLAGYMGDLDVFDKILAPAWREVIKGAPHKISEFKTSKCRNGQGEFLDELGWTQGERLELAVKLIDIIEFKIPKERITGYSAVIAFPGYWPKTHAKEMERMAFSICFLDLLDAIRAMAPLVLEDGEEVAIVLDNKPKYWNLVARNFKATLSHLEPSFAARIQYPIFKDSKCVEALQAADLLAHESMKETKTRMEQPGRPVSKALQRLVSSHYHLARCMTYDQVVEIDRRRKAGLAFGDELRAMPLFESGTKWRQPTLHWPFKFDPGTVEP